MRLTPKAPAGVEKRFLLVYGSQTGQAKAIAEDIADKAASRGLKADVQCADGVDAAFDLKKEQLFVLICSSTGEGEPPDNAAKFLRKIKNKALKKNHLSHLQYTILGLGDTNYTNFCNCPKEFNKRLEELGAVPFYPPAWADDAVGLDIVCDPWIEGLWTALGQNLHTTEISSTEDDSTSTNAPSVTEADAPTSPAFPTLTRSVAPLNSASLSVPSTPIPYLCVQWRRDAVFTTPAVPHNGASFPSAMSEVFSVPIRQCWRLTSDDAVKTALDVCLDSSGTSMRDMTPGDAFGVVVHNTAPEVEFVLERLRPTGNDGGGDATSDGHDTPFSLELIPDSGKAKAEVPPFVPDPVTARHLVQDLLDIRVLPKKALLRSMAECCHDEGQKRRLLELSSKQGAKDFDAFIRQPGLGFIDILGAFPAIRPPIEKLVEQLPRLQARSYSMSSSPMRTSGFVHFVFNIVEHSDNEYHVFRPRKGLCTGFLDSVTKEHQLQGAPLFDDNAECPSISSLSISNIDPPSTPLPSLLVFRRANSNFRHPDDLARPLMMIGPGTGVAPFLGFLQHRERLIADANLSPEDVGETWLFFGCRHKEKDFLYREELERLHRVGVLSRFLTSFSRDLVSATTRTEDSVSTASGLASTAVMASAVASPAAASLPEGGSTQTPVKYVQHRIVELKEEVSELISRPDAMIFVCGDAKHMARNVHEALVEALMSRPSTTKMAAMQHLAAMRDDRRYLQDVWA